MIRKISTKRKIARSFLVSETDSRGRKYDNIDGFEVVPMENGTKFYFPKYGLGSYEDEKVPEGHCAGYAKKVARELFELDYVTGENRGEAWNLRYSHVTVDLDPYRSASDLMEKFDRGIVTPGDLVAIRRNSTWNERKDVRGFPITNSHIEIVIGKDSYKRLCIGGQIVDERRTIDVQRLIFQGLTPIEVIKPDLKPGVELY